MTLSSWCSQAQGGEQTVYFTGEIARANPAIAAEARRLAASGEVCLTQRRIQKQSFQYIATKTFYRRSDLTWPVWPSVQANYTKRDFNG